MKTHHFATLAAMLTGLTVVQVCVFVTYQEIFWEVLALLGLIFLSVSLNLEALTK